MTCPRVQRAIKRSTLTAPLRHTLSVLTDHIKSFTDPATGWVDHQHPATLVMYKSVRILAAETGYSKPTVMVHLLKLQGFTPIPGMPKQKWPQDETRAVLELYAEATPRQAARYYLNLERLEDLADPTRVPASTPALQRSKNLTAESAQGVRHLTPSGQETLPELVKTLPKAKKSCLAQARETTNRTASPVYTPTPDQLNLPDDFLACCRNTVPELDVSLERMAFLGYCRRHDIFNQSWLGAFWDWLLKAQAREQRGEPTASHPYPSQVITASTATRTTCSWAGCDEPPCPHGQACAYHAGCAGCCAEVPLDADGSEIDPKGPADGSSSVAEDTLGGRPGLPDG